MLLISPFQGLKTPLITKQRATPLLMISPFQGFKTLLIIQQRAAPFAIDFALSGLIHPQGQGIILNQNILVTLLQYGYKISLKVFAKGIYFVALKTEKESMTKKMVKM